MDLCGPMQVKSSGGNLYLATFLDDCTGMSVLRPIARKSDAIEEIKSVITQLETQSGHRVLQVRTDRGGEYINKELKLYYAKKGIVHQTTAPYTPEQNGAAERLNRTIIERVRAMLKDNDLPLDMWAEAAVTANYLRNRSPSLQRTKTPWELFNGTKPNVSGLRVFGSPAYVHVPKELRRKLDPVSRKGKLVGYESHSKAYRVLLEDSGKIVVGRDITFYEAKIDHHYGPPSPSVPGPGKEALELLFDSEEEAEDKQAEEQAEEEAPVALEAPAPAPAEPEPGLEAEPGPAPVPAGEDKRYPARERRPPAEWFKAPMTLSAEEEPFTYEDAITSDIADQWKQAMDE